MNAVMQMVRPDSGPLNERVEQDFAFLDSPNVQIPKHYLDNAATTQMPQPVVEAITGCYRDHLAPVFRGIYPLAEEATHLYQQSRQEVGHFIHAPNPEQLIFTRSCTESINLVAEGWARKHLSSGDWVWVTRMEHHANFLPWQRVCEQSGAILRILELDEEGTLEQPFPGQLFDKRSKLIAITHVSNVLGVENRIADLCLAASEQGIAVLVDGAQAVGHMSVNVEELGCDFYAFSAHKMYGPVGIGALYAKPERLREMEPMLLGGGMVDLVGDRQSTWADIPQRFEAGSPNYPGAIGFAAAAKYLSDLGMDEVHSHVSMVSKLMASYLHAIPNMRVFTNPLRSNTSLVSFDLEGVHPHDFAQLAASQGVAIRAGHHCCQPLMKHLGVAATNRASFGIYSSYKDVVALVKATEHVHDVFL